MSDGILVVDDEPMILELAAMVLGTRGYEVFRAQSGEEGLRMVAEKRPAVALLDYMLPGMDGMTALRRIRQEFPETYVVMLTGKGSEEIAVELMKAGASDYILKPFRSHDLLERIGNVLRVRRAELSNLELRRERERLLKEIESWNLELERRIAEKTQELEAAHKELLLGEKLVALGHVVAGMAHEIRNPLNAISLFAQILHSGMEQGSEAAECAEKILQEVDRIDGILLKLLATSKRSHFAPEEVFLPAVADRVAEIFAATFKAHRVRPRLDIEPGLPVILADPGELEQIFTNLISNSVQAMAGRGGDLGIRMFRDDRFIHIAVSDSGPGIPRENLSKIFDPFFTTKEKGTGFGLSVVLRIVKSYGGAISVESRDGEGAAFHIQLPLGGEGGGSSRDSEAGPSN
ncbi:MAG: response regulator [Deltaproteobacteria bacterium]|nr:response regulator [Deltaproteobacteria bacterium]